MPSFASVSQPPARYWQEEAKDEEVNDGEQTKLVLQQKDQKTPKAKKRKQEEGPKDEKKVKPEVRQ